MKLEDKIKIISKAIEQDTGSKCEVVEHDVEIEFKWYGNLPYHFLIAKKMLERLPLSPDSVSKESLHTTPDEWVSVKERVPQDNQDYLLLTDKGMILTGRNRESNLEKFKYWMDWRDEKIPMEIAFWQPLPPAPKK